MKKALLLGALLFAQPLTAQPTAPPIAESKMANSSVSVLVDARLDDGRLVIKVAAQNRTTAAVPFGPGSISIARPNGQVIALIPLQRLLDDVRLAAGMPVESQSAQVPTAGAYAAPQMMVDGTGRTDVSGYTGGMGVSGAETIRRSNQPRAKSRPTVSEAQANAQIAALKQGILQDVTVQPGQVVAAQIVSEKLKFGKGDDRTLQLRIRIAGDEHGFTIAAPTG